MKIIATTTQSKKQCSDIFEDFILETGFQYISRDKKSIAKLLEDEQADYLIIWEEMGPIAYNHNAEKFYFHPSMAKKRLSTFRKKNQLDNLITVSNLSAGNSFLDCTMGLGADSIVASYFTQISELKESPRVIGLESSVLIAAVVKWGMKLYQSRISWLNEAIKRIDVINTDHQDYLRKSPDKSFDVVYFDPMFRRPIYKSQAINPLRSSANHATIDLETIKEALRVARKKVILKERPSSSEFERLGINKIVHSKNNPIAYGVIDCN